MAKCYKSKWIISGDGNLFEDSVMVVEEGKIQGIYKESEFDKSSYKHFRDYGNSVITPGFINLHNHLQYTDIKKVTPKGLKAILKRLFSKLKKKYYLGDVRKNSFVSESEQILLEISLILLIGSVEIIPVSPVNKSFCNVPFSSIFNNCFFNSP